MDSKPIFDFLTELEFRAHYKRPSTDADRSALGRSKGAYYRKLRLMERQFEASLFQCIAEDSDFNVGGILSRLCECRERLRSYIDSVPHPANLDGQIALRVSTDCLFSLRELGIIKSESKDTKTTVDGVALDTSKIDWDKPVYTADEVKSLLGVSDSTFRRWVNGGWIAYSQMDGSDKKFIQREHLLAFLNNPKVHYPSSK